MNTLELKSLWRMVKGMPTTGTHAARLDAFYRPQAEYYDRLRKRMLHGREKLLEMLALPSGSRVVELGAGTGAMLDLWGARAARFESLELVDICPSLLNHARLRTRHLHNVRVIEADASAYSPSQPVDCVYFSYALTMIPDWLRALTNALNMLKPGGKLGVVDFYVAGANDSCARMNQDAVERWFWTRWFGHDQVRLSPVHLAALCLTTDRLQQHEGRAPLPYLPWLKAPYYAFVGAKPPRLRSDVIAQLWKQNGGSR
jgi:S-adenosylmethionine-diacylgycerolhomoserine-N-methlytransferase